MSVRLAQSSFKAARSPVFSPLYNALMTTSEAAGGSATTDVMVMLRAAGKKAFFPSTNPATGWWQDSAGTTQAALEQPVGRITDLSGGSFHATQATSLNRPLYTQRVNDLQRTEDISNAAWTKTNCSASSATVLLATAGSGIPRVEQVVTSLATEYVFTARLKQGTHRYAQIYITSQTGLHLNIDLQAGTISNTGFTAATIAAASDGAYDVTVTYTITVGTRPAIMIAASGSATRAQTWSPAGTETIEILRQDRRLSAFSAMNLPAYQRVGNGTAGVADYDTAGFRPMLYFDGTSDALATSAIDLTGTDQIMALCNVLKVSDASGQIVYETSANAGTTNGAIYLSAPQNVNPNYGVSSRGTAQSLIITASSFAAPNLSCFKAIADISSDVLTLYRNGAEIGTSASDQGTGNYGNHALYIGARAGTSVWFKGYMIPGFMGDTTGIPAALLDQMAREQAALWGVAI
jgi:hypothetical protein